MLKRHPLIALGSALILSACTQAPVPSSTQPSSVPYGIQQADSEGANDASLDAILRELDNMSDEQPATSSAGPVATQNAWGFRVQQRDRDRDRDGDRDRGYGWSGGYGYGPYGYGVFARCQRIYRRCLNRAYYYYSGTNPYQFCRRLRNRCVSAQWWR